MTNKLVRRAVDGNRAAFAALVTRHYDFIFRVAWKLCGAREDAEDIAQDVCVRLARGIQSWNADGKFSTWIYSVVLNAVRDFHRRGASETRKRKAWADEPNRPDIQGDGQNDQDDALSELWAAVRQLPHKQCNAVTLVYGEGLSHLEAAKAMDCAEGTVSSHIHEAKKRLKMLVAGVDRESAGAK